MVAKVAILAMTYMFTCVVQALHTALLSPSWSDPPSSSFLSLFPPFFLPFFCPPLLFFPLLPSFFFASTPSSPPPPSQLFLVTSPPSLLLLLAPSLSSYLIISPLSLTSPSYLPLPHLFFSPYLSLIFSSLSSFSTDYSTHHGAMLACLYTSILHTLYLLNSSLSTELSTTCVNWKQM